MSYEAESLLRIIMHDIAFLRNALTPEIPEGARCEGCRFFFNPSRSDIGECHRNAPNALRDGDFGFWPVIGKGCWCGEFRPKGGGNGS
jgi:hypothetical protein